MLLRLGRPIDLKGNERSAAVVDLLLFDSEKELAAYSMRGTERRWAVARTGTLSRENRAANAAGGTTWRVGVEVVVYYRWGREDGIGKVPLLVGADATAVQEKDGLVQKDASVDRRISLN
ncbi:hypothetical protein GW17_00047728 [Ensete ventricosum]|nr:hypothetical protein GW17_00047728 [Ensete ventricosum]